MYTAIVLKDKQDKEKSIRTKQAIVNIWKLKDDISIRELKLRLKVMGLR